MTNQPLLSVIIPVYKVEKYLRQCVDSVINQTYKNLEIILVDDGSPDNCGKICDEYAQKDRRIKVIHQLNKGVSAARNLGTKLAQGEYITYVDSDDWLDVCMYEELFKVLNEYKLDMVRCAAFESDGNSKKVIAPKKEYANKLFTDKEVFERYFDEFLCKVIWNTIYEAKIVKGIMSPDGYRSEDNYVSGMYLYRSKRMMIIDTPLYYYRKNPESITNSGNIRSIDICLCTYQLICDLQAEGFSDGEMLKLLYKKLAREIFHFIRDKNEKYKIVKMKKELYSFLLNNLDLRRRLQLVYLMRKRKIYVQ